MFTPRKAAPTRHRVLWRGVQTCWLFLVATSILLASISPVASCVERSQSQASIPQPVSPRFDPPDPKVQAFLRNLLSKDESRMIDGDEAWLHGKLEELEDLVGGDRVRLVPQLLYFSVNAADMREGMLPAAIIEQLNMSMRELALGVLPCLDATNTGLRRAAADALGLVESDPDTDELTFVVYRDLVKDLGFDRTSGFVQRMYARDPELAIRTVAEVIEGEESASRLLEREVGREPERLRALSTRPEWWIRLYVAAILAKEPQRGAELATRLRTDPHPLVRSFVERIPPSKDDD